MSEKREFASKADWELVTKLEVFNGLDAFLRPLDGEINADIVRGDAMVCMEVTIAESVTIGGMDAYCHQTVKLGSYYSPRALP